MTLNFEERAVIFKEKIRGESNEKKAKTMVQTAC